MAVIFHGLFFIVAFSITQVVHAICKIVASRGMVLFKGKKVLLLFFILVASFSQYLAYCVVTGIGINY